MEKILNFEEWKKECKRLLYEANTSITDENIAYVDMEHYEDYYNDGLTPKEANEAAYDNAMQNE
jgi:hypothetical protein